MPTELERREFLTLIGASSVGGAAGCYTREDGGQEVQLPIDVEQPMPTQLDNNIQFLHVSDRDELHSHNPVKPTIYFVEDPGEIKTWGLADA